MSDKPATYAAVAMQLTARSREHLSNDDARQAMLDHIAEVEARIRTTNIFVEQFGGVPIKLAVLPEYLFTSYPGRISVPDFAEKVCWASDGPEYEAMGAVAQRLGMFISGNAYETDEHFPGFYFQTCFVIAPSGDVILRYRRLLSMYAPSPHDVWDMYLDRYGIEGVFPVVDTEIGRLAAIASEEILYPEIARMMGFRGAEIFLHNSSEIGSPIATAKDIAKQARAFENVAYVVSANSAGIDAGGLPLACADGGSRIVDYRGKMIAQSLSGETMTAFANIDLAGLRSARRTPAMINSLARQRPGLFADGYAAADEHFHQANAMMEDGKPAVPERDYFKRAQAEVIARLDKAGII